MSSSVRVGCILCLRIYSCVFAAASAAVSSLTLQYYLVGVCDCVCKYMCGYALMCRCLCVRLNLC